MIHSFKWLLVVVLLLTIYPKVYSQPFLILKKEGAFRRSVYQEGDVFSFQLKNDKQRKNLVIKKMYADTIEFAGGAVTIGEIEAVFIKNDYRNWNPSTYTYFFVIAGTGYAGLAAINDGKVDQRTWITSAALVSTGLLINVLKRKKVKIQNKVKLEIQELLQ